MSRILSSIIKNRILATSPLCYRNIAHLRCISHLTSTDYHGLLCQLNLSFYPSIAHERHMGFMQDTRERLKRFFTDKTIVRASGALTFEKLGDDIDYVEFGKCFELPDTFYSWFLCIQLHVWMTITTTISERQGRMFRNSLVEAMWNDVEFRMDKLGTMKKSRKKKYLQELVGQFQASLLSYDEGILSDDTVLAAAVWRTLYSSQLVDPQLIERAVLYIRKQLSYLDSQNSQNIIFNASINFLTLNNIFSDYKQS